jgi:hypothetical protein
MCTPAPVIPAVLHAEPVALRSSPAPVPMSLRQRLKQWIVGWKQSLIAELACLGQPREGFL